MKRRRQGQKPRQRTNRSGVSVIENLLMTMYGTGSYIFWMIIVEKMKESLARAAEAKKNAAPEPVAVVEPEPVAIAEPEPVAATKPEPVTVVAAPAAAAASGDITPKRIKELRDATGAGMMDCKKALIDSDGDMEAATEILRTKGLAKADKKASRIAAEGKIAGAAAGDKAVLVEINCETDFVAKDSSFMDFTKSVANAALSFQGDDVEGLLAAGIDGTTVEESRQALVSKIGENIQVRRLVGRGGSGTTVGAYVHMNRIGVLVEIEGGTTQLAEDVAMHVAAMNPPFAVPGDVSQEVLDKERAFLTQQALDSGKPKEIVDKMVEGRIRKYLEEICLVSQTYVKTNDKTVGKLLEENGAKMVGFTRIEVGEGIEKRQDDFAAEVAKMAAGGV
jgi:elongation factor Ts